MIIVIQNDIHVPPGRVTELMVSRNISHSVWMASDPASPETLPENTSGLIVLGGIMGAWESATFPFLNQVQNWMAEAISRHIPVLGICLGGQLLAKATGGRVMPDCRGEKGIEHIHILEHGQTDPLFNGLPETSPTFQWHEDAFEPPPDAVTLASSDNCPFQAFRIGLNAYGIQFHPEITPRIASSWARLSTIKPGAVETQLMAHYDDYQHHASLLLNNFIHMTSANNRSAPYVATPIYQECI